MIPTLPKVKRPILRYGMRVRVTDPNSFYYGLTGTLGAAEMDEPYLYIELDVESEEEDQELHPVHYETVTPLGENDPDYDGVEFEEEDEEEDEEIII